MLFALFQEERVMGVLLSILFALLACLLGGLYYPGAFRQRRPGEPPLARGPIPWLGHALEFRRDMATFLERMKQEYGDIFTVQLRGSYYTFLMDPLSFGAVFKEARTKLDFEIFIGRELYRIFGYESTEYDRTFHPSKYIMGDELLLVITQAMMSMQDIVFRAGYLALFYEFRKYDQLFPKLIFGGLSPYEKREEERLLELFRSTLSVQKLEAKDYMSDWVREQQRRGFKEFMHDRYMAVLLWLSQVNAGPSAFWLLLYLMKHPEAMKAVKAEVEEVLRETGQEVKHGGPLIDLTQDMLMSTPVLDSAVEETLRLSGTPLLHRAVLQDMTLKMDDGREYAIREGDGLTLFPYTAVQTDPEVYPEPLSFKYDRFLNPDRSRKTDFYKAGKKLKYYNMPWGGGVTMCPGRLFATNELKQFIFLMLIYFDLELKKPDEEMPDNKHQGFGTAHPSRDIQFRHRLRF